MSSSSNDRYLGRREFLRLGALTATSAGVSGAALGQNTVPEAAPPATAAAASPASRVLGRTGLKVNVIGIGTLQITEPALIQAAMDMGVNYIDTARVYINGRSEETVGKAVQGRRDKVFISTKTPPNTKTKQGVVENVEKSLKAIGTDYIDVLELHQFNDASLVLNAELREALTELRKAGKIRFVGFTTHKNQADVLNAVADDPDKFFDVAMLAYNFQSGQDVKDAIARVAKNGVGVVAMKTQNGGHKAEALGGISPHQASLKWVLQDPNITCAVPGMVDLVQIRENVEVMNSLKLTRVDEQILERYAEAIKPVYCGLCGKCEPGCPLGVQVSTVNRSLMYAEGYGDMALARETYHGIPSGASAITCGDCADCTAKCVRGLDIAAKMRQARELLG
jgi:predicted aldo/keto reductase-like oxidoreductase